MAWLRTSAGWLAAMLAVSYPLAAYLGFLHGEARLAGLLLLFAMVLRMTTARSRGALMMTTFVLGALFAAAIYITRSPVLARLYPVVVNASLLAAFGLSLIWPPAIITRIAQATGRRLDANGIAYTRNVTVIWCGFFAVNGCIALYTALHASWENWVLYNGLIAYLLGGLLFGIEWFVRPSPARAADAN